MKGDHDQDHHRAQVAERHINVRIHVASRQKLQVLKNQPKKATLGSCVAVQKFPPVSGQVN
jgi:hypothetical protein